MAEYIIEPFDTDPEEIFQRFVEFIQVNYPDWQPSDGQLDVMTARFFSTQIAMAADLASNVQRSIFRYFGSTILNIQPLMGSYAQGVGNFFKLAGPGTAQTLPFGTFVGLTDRNGDVAIFSTMADGVFSDADTVQQIEIQAIEEGEFSSRLSGTIQMVEMTDWITNAVMVGETSGGADAESDELYLQRLVDNIALMTPRPIMASDFAIISKNIPGVWRSAVLDNFEPGENMIQSVVVTNSTGGTFSIGVTHNGLTNEWDFPHDSDSDTFNDIMGTQAPRGDSVQVISPTDISVAGGPLGTAPILVEYIGKFGMTTDAPVFAIDDTNLVGSGHDASTALLEAGVPWVAGTKPMSIGISSVDKDGNEISGDIKQQLMDYLNGMRTQNFIITFVHPAYHEVSVQYEAMAVSPTGDPASLTSLADGSLERYLGPEVSNVDSNDGTFRTWIPSRTIRYLELTTIIENTQGIDHTVDLTFSVDGGPFDKEDKVIEGPFTLTRVGTIEGIVNIPAPV